MAKGADMLLALGGLKKPKGEAAEGEMSMEDEAPDLKAEAKADLAAAMGDDAAEAIAAYVQACMGGEY
jgi:putative heme iron utilization protein